MWKDKLLINSAVFLFKITCAKVILLHNLLVDKKLAYF